MIWHDFLVGFGGALAATMLRTGRPPSKGERIMLGMLLALVAVITAAWFA